MNVNPIPRSSMFATPVDFDSLESWIERLHGSEKTVAWTAAMMAFNLANKLVADAAKEVQS